MKTSKKRWAWKKKFIRKTISGGWRCRCEWCINPKRKYKNTTSIKEDTSL